MKRLKHLFLDLEDTVLEPVEDWYTTKIVNDVMVGSIIQVCQPDYVHLFSFAIRDDFDLGAFNEGARPALEKALGVKFTMTWTCEDMLRLIARVDHTRYEDLSFGTLLDLGKQLAFKTCIRSFFKAPPAKFAAKSTEVMLLDDTVFDQTFSWPAERISGSIVNIVDLVKKGNPCPQSPQS